MLKGVRSVLLGTLRSIGRLIPDWPYIRAIPNRILKPVHFMLGGTGGVVKLLDFQMLLDPRECVDGNLWFAPQLYDRKEIAYLLNRLPAGGVFLDIGSNIGFWSLRFAKVFPRARIIAVEANPQTSRILRSNLQLNGFDNVQVIELGLSDHEGMLSLYCNRTGNRGGDSFSEKYASRDSLPVRVTTLEALLKNLDVHQVDVMKIDIEGYEPRVLSPYFQQVAQASWPRCICAEVTHDSELHTLLSSVGYRRVLMARENAVYER